MTPLAAPLLAFALSVAATLAIASHLLSLARLPSYATWTGVATLERKLELYREFAAAGPVDLLLYGDSCTDHGVSAELLTQELSRYYGRPYRVFNFSTGAGGNRTFPLVYRLLRSVAKPKRIAYFYNGGRRRGLNEEERLKPEYILQHAPVGKAIRDETRLRAEAFAWRQPLLKHASAARDALFHFDFVNWRQTHLEIYRINSYGDTMSLLFEHDHARLEEERRVRARLFDGLMSQCPPADASCATALLGEADWAGLAEVAKLSAQDGAEIVLMRHDSALGYLSTPDDPEYRAGLEALTAAARTALGNVPVLGHPGFVPHRYEIADAMHLNRTGALRLTHRFAALLAGRPAPAEPAAAAYCAFTKRDLETYGPYAAMVMKPAGRWATLHVRLHTGRLTQRIDWQNPPRIVLERADCTDADAMPVRDGADDALTARFPDLPERAEAQIIRLPGYNIPLRAAWWTD